MSRNAKPPGAGAPQAAAGQTSTQPPSNAPAQEKQAAPLSPEHQFVVNGLRLLDQFGPAARLRAQCVRVRVGDPLAEVVLL